MELILAMVDDLWHRYDLEILKRLTIQIVAFLQRRDYCGGERGRDVEFVGVFCEDD